MIYSKTEQTQLSINVDEGSRTRVTRDVPHLFSLVMMRSRWRLPGAHSPPRKQMSIFNSEKKTASHKSIIR